MDWFPYDNGLRHERVKEKESFYYEKERELLDEFVSF